MPSRGHSRGRQPVHSEISVCGHPDVYPSELLGRELAQGQVALGVLSEQTGDKGLEVGGVLRGDPRKHGGHGEMGQGRKRSH